MPSCREVTRLLASGEVERAPALKRILTRVHLLMCDDCRRYSRELRGLAEMAREALRTPVDPVRLAALERAILERMDSGEPPQPPSTTQ